MSERYELKSVLSSSAQFSAPFTHGSICGIFVAGSNVNLESSKSLASSQYCHDNRLALSGTNLLDHTSIHVEGEHAHGR
jgi:hypothetical protein